MADGAAEARPDPDFRMEIAEMIVEALVLEDVEAADIEPDAPLFNEGLCLDSIDALELSFAIAKRYGIKIRSGDEQNARIFASLNALSAFIGENRTK